MEYTQAELSQVDLSNDIAYTAAVAFLRRICRQPEMAQLRKQFSYIEQWLAAHPSFVESYPERTAELNTLVVYMKWLALQALTYPEPVLELFHQHVNALFDLPTDLDVPEEDNGAPFALVEGLRGCLLNVMLWEERDLFKKQISQALLTNEEVVTSEEFFRGIKAVPATLKNWFSEYIEFMGTEPFIPARQDRFFKTNENAQALSDREKNKLRLLFNVYERLRISSTKPAGVEEEISFEADDGSTGAIRYGKIEFDNPAEKKRYYDNYMNIYRPIFINSGLYDPATIIAMDPRPGVTAPVAKVNSFTKPTKVSGPDIAATVGPDHFTEQDEAEITQLAKTQPALVRKDNYVVQATELKQQLHITFTTPDVEKKFTDLLISVLRGLRDVTEFKQYLLDLHYPTLQIDTIVAAIKAKTSPKTAHRSKTLPGAVTPMKLATTPKLSQVQASSTPIETIPLPAQEQVEPAKQSSKPKSFVPKLRRSRILKKPIIDDVKLQPAMVMGPIDELRAMDVLEFRRLSPDPVQAAARLRDKIELLAEESLVKQTEGIQAFKESPLNVQYLEIGNQSIASGQTVEAIITQLAAQGTPSLSQAEFNAIADLNRQLRF